MALSELKIRLRAVRSALWYRPALFSAVAIIVLALVSLFDTKVGLPAIEVIERDAVTDLLRFMAGGMLTITTVSLSVLMLVLSLAAGQASPRTVPELMADEVTQNALSTFLSTLVFALTALVLLASNAIEGAGLAAVLGLALFMLTAAIKYLVQWIDHVANTLKLNRIIERVYGQAESVLDTYLARSWEVNGELESDPGEAIRDIHAECAGYVQLIDIAALDSLAAEGKVSLRLAVREGDFVHPTIALMTVSPAEDLGDELAETLRRAIVVGFERSAEGDALLGLELLAEVACRALSASVNDPQSAIICINYLGALLVRAGAVAPGNYPPTRSPSGRVILLPVTFEDMLKRAVRPVMREGAACAEVICAVVGVLRQLTDVAAGEYLPAIQAEAQAAAEHGGARLQLERDKEQLARQLDALYADVQRRTKR